MFELCIVIAAFAVLYYRADYIISSAASTGSLDGPGDHSEAPTDKSTPPVHFPSRKIVHHSNPPPTHHHNAPQQPTVCPVCYPPPPKVFAPIDPNPKYVAPVHSRDCPMQPRWVYSRRPKSNATAHNSGPHRFTTDDLIDLRQIHPGDPDFNPTAPFITSAPTPPTPTFPSAHTTIPPPSTPLHTFPSQLPHQLHLTPTYPLTPNTAPSYPSYLHAYQSPSTTIVPTTTYQVDVANQYEPLSEVVQPDTPQPTSFAMEVEVAPSSFPITDTGAMDVEPANPPTQESGIGAMDVDPIPLPTLTTEIADMEVESDPMVIVEEDLTMIDATVSMDDGEDNILVDLESLMDYDEDVIFTDAEASIDGEDVVMTDEDLETEVDGVWRQLAELTISDTPELDGAMVIWD
ncbi:hypothetical protein FRB93_004330 [Tulasnella sp. JGI-2019a]|nr:hypothetical protein FRB93_004330 [Tulasnella sp. JGI-2019a]